MEKHKDKEEKKKYFQKLAKAMSINAELPPYPLHLKEASDERMITKEGESFSFVERKKS